MHGSSLAETQFYLDAEIRVRDRPCNSDRVQVVLGSRLLLTRHWRSKGVDSQ